MEKPRFVWKGGKLVSWDDGVAHVASPALHEGLAVFEELRCYRDEKTGRLYAFRLDDHIDRLRRGAAALMLGDVPSSRRIAHAAGELVAAHEFDSCCLRMTITPSCDAEGCSAGNSMRVADSAELTIVCWQEAEGDHPEDGATRDALSTEVDGVAVCTSSWRMSAVESCHAQMRSSLSSGVIALAKREVAALPTGGAVLLNDAGEVCQSTCGSVFVVRDGVLSTPPLSAGAYDGVMRDTVLNLAIDMDVPTIEERLTRMDLYMADEVLAADDLAGIVAVTSVDGRTIGKGRPGAVTQAVLKRFAKASVGDLAECSAWLTEVAQR